MMDFMRSSHSTGVPVVCISEKFEALVYKNVVHHKIGDSITQNTKTDRKTLPKPRVVRNHYKRHAYNGVKNKEGIVAFKPRVVIFSMMVFMKTPKKTVHNILMGKPRHKFHKAERPQKNKEPKDNFHLDQL